MIYGIGTDIIEIDRITKAISKNQRFLEKHFTEKEQELFLEKSNLPQTIAGNFSSKESISKALGTGVRGFSLKDIEILRDKNGKPIVNLSQNIIQKFNLKNYKVHLSISHDKTKAISFAMIEIL